MKEWIPALAGMTKGLAEDDGVDCHASLRNDKSKIVWAEDKGLFFVVYFKEELENE